MLESMWISPAAACRTLVITARARDAREMYSVSNVSFGAELGRPPMRLRLNKPHNIVLTLSIQVCRHQISGIDRATDLLDPLVFLSAALQKSQPSRCCTICPDSYVSLVSQLLYCIGQRWPHSHRIPCCSILARRCSVTPPPISTTRWPRCVDRCASCSQVLNVVFFGLPAASVSESPSIVRCSPHLEVGTPTRHAACGANIVRHVSGVWVCTRCCPNRAAAFHASKRDVGSVSCQISQSC